MQTVEDRIVTKVCSNSYAKDTHLHCRWDLLLHRHGSELKAVPVQDINFFMHPRCL